MMTETTILTLCFLTLGIFLIIRGGDAFVDAAGWIAEISGIPQFIIGATVVSIATTLPELFVSALAALAGKADMAVGNAVGSVTANLGFIMALSLICLPCVMRRRQFVTKGALMAMAATLLIIGSAGGYLTLADSILLLIIFLIFILENIRSARKGTLSPPAGPVRNIVAPGEWRQNITKFIFGAAAILIGAKLMVQNGSQLAMILGVPERIIAVTVIAIGTSLP
ncbi:MAG: sodium:calcium antiporter, partial [Anaerovorax sp.]